jgi:hypothetical protein
MKRRCKRHRCGIICVPLCARITRKRCARACLTIAWCHTLAAVCLTQDERYWNSGEVILFRSRATAIARIPGSPSKAADTTAVHSSSSGRATPAGPPANTASAHSTPAQTPRKIDRAASPKTLALPPRTPVKTPIPSAFSSPSPFTAPPTPKTSLDAVKASGAHPPDSPV